MSVWLCVVVLINCRLIAILRLVPYIYVAIKYQGYFSTYHCTITTIRYSAQSIWAVRCQFNVVNLQFYRTECLNAFKSYFSR